MRKVCSQHLWMPVPQELEDLIVDVATEQIAPEDVDSSPYGMLFELAVSIVHEHIGYGTFATIYDDEVSVLPNANRRLLTTGVWEPIARSRVAVSP